MYSMKQLFIAKFELTDQTCPDTEFTLAVKRSIYSLPQPTYMKFGSLNLDAKRIEIYCRTTKLYEQLQ